LQGSLGLSSPQLSPPKKKYQKRIKTKGSILTMYVYMLLVRISMNVRTIYSYRRQERERDREGALTIEDGGFQKPKSPTGVA